MSLQDTRFGTDFYETYLEEISRFKPDQERHALLDIDYVHKRYNPEECDDDWRAEETRRNTERRPPSTKREYTLLGTALR